MQFKDDWIWPESKSQWTQKKAIAETESEGNGGTGAELYSIILNALVYRSTYEETLTNGLPQSPPK